MEFVYTKERREDYMKRYIPATIVSVTLLLLAFIIDFRLTKEEAPVQQVVKKVVVVKKIYIKIPSDSNNVVVDTIQLVTPAVKPKNDLNNYRRSRFMHRPGPVS
jgi:hypothetical protein